MKIEMNSANALVAYLDVLGYSELIKSGEYANTIYGAINSSILRWRENLKKHRFNLGKTIQENTSLSVISDTLIIALDQEAVFLEECQGDVSKVSPALKELVLFIFLNLVSYLSQDCMREIKRPLRGAVAAGKYYSRKFENLDGNSFIFSEGLVRAHQFSEEFADVPRILIHDTALEGVKASLLAKAERPDREILQDQDGMRHLNLYASIFTDEALGSILRHIARVVSQQMDCHQTNPKILRKYIWFANYHNQRVQDIIASDAHPNSCPSLAEIKLDRDSIIIQIPDSYELKNENCQI